MTDVPWMEWYQSLAKPSGPPAPRTIGLIWQILYPIIIATFGFVFVRKDSPVNGTSAPVFGLMSDS